MVLCDNVIRSIYKVIVDAAVEQREKDITTLAADLDYELEEDLKLLGRVFKQVDLNEDGELSLDELVTGAESVPEFASRLRVMDIDAAELEQLLGTTPMTCGIPCNNKFRFRLCDMCSHAEASSQQRLGIVENVGYSESNVENSSLLLVSQGGKGFSNPQLCKAFSYT